MEARSDAMRIFTEQITIIRARTVPGDYGGTVDDWDNPIEIPVAFPVTIQPQQGSEETTTQSHLVTEKYRAYTLPPHLLLDLKPTDRIRVDTWGKMLWAAGPPEHWRTEKLAHTEFTLEKINGAKRN